MEQGVSPVLVSLGHHTNIQPDGCTLSRPRTELVRRHPPAEPIFQVSAMTHIGALLFWFDRTRTRHGWWSFLPILIRNWIALGHRYVAPTTAQGR